MSTSISTFVALGLLALPPSDCPGGCGSHLHLPLPGRHVESPLDAGFDWTGDYGDLTASQEFAMFEPFEPAAPVVLLRSLALEAADRQTFLASSDQPAYRTAVPFGPLSVEVQIPLAETDPAAVEYVVLLLDGKPVENNRYSAGTQAAAMPRRDGQPGFSFVFNFPCPALGKHVVQARYKKAGLWSRSSAPLPFDVRLPAPPQIVAMSDVDRVPAPVRGGGRISITKSEVIVRLANVSQNAQVIAYLDGKPISTVLSQESCCRTIRLQGHLTPGMHSLRMRTVAPAGACSVTSEPSGEVVFHYYDEDAYLLGPNRRCNRCPTPANNGSQARHTIAPPSAEPIAQQPVHRSNTASDKDADGFQLAKFVREDGKSEAEAAGKLAAEEEADAEERIAVVQAQDRIERARAIQGPSSPFYFASAAHFPLPDYGLRGERIDRGGLTIYEDMEFRFDRQGNYEVRFRATAPAMPTTVQLQFQIQPCRGGPWYTVTLAPIEFKYPDSNAGKAKCASASICGESQEQQCCGPVRDCVCQGRSEILRRCYGEMGQDASIRRTGTARFGFGVKVDGP
jgi:hypothetical protein